MKNYDRIINAMKDLQEYKKEKPTYICIHNFQPKSQRSGDVWVCKDCGFVMPGKFVNG